MENDKPQNMPPVPPFVRFVCANVPMVFDDSLSYYEALCALWKYVQGMTDVINNNATLEEEYIEKFDELKEFVDNYFDNLDVQEEINNKLDQMAEDGTLAEIIAEYIDDTIKVIFPSYTIDGNDTLGDCEVIKGKTKSFMIDCFTDNANCYTGIKGALEDNEITHLDYFMITHYHGDHIGNLARLIADGYIDENTEIYLPRTVTVDGTTWDGASVKNILEDANLEYITIDNQTIEFDNITVKLLNGSADDYAYYQNYVGTTVSYNNYSVYADVRYKDKKILFTGDGEMYSNVYVNETYLTDTGYDLLKDGHHGFATFTPDFSAKVIPKNVVITASVGMINGSLHKWGTQASYWSDVTPNIYVTGVQKDAVVFEIGSDVRVISNSYASSGVANRGVLNYYLDSTTTKQNHVGSAEFPFKTLEEASYLMPKNTSQKVTLHVINLNEGSDIFFAGYKRLEIDFDNNAINQEMHFENIETLTLSNVVTSSFMVIEDCRVNVDNFESTNASQSNPLRIYRSKAVITGALKFANTTNLTMIQLANSDTTLNITSLTFDATGGSRLLNAFGSRINFYAGTITILKNYPFLSSICNQADSKQCNFSENIKELLTLFTDSTGVTSATTKEAVSKYDYYDVVLKTASSHRIITRVTPATTGGGSYMYRNGDYTKLYCNYCLIGDSGTTVSIKNGGQTQINSDGTIDMVQSDILTIVKIIGVIA